MPTPLDNPSPNPQKIQAIATALRTFYSANSSISGFAPYLYLQSFSVEKDFPAAAGKAMQAGGRSFINKFVGCTGSDLLNLYLDDRSDLNTNANKIFSGTNQDFQVFICMDQTALSSVPGVILLPYQTAKLLSSCFVYGLATRLILQKYKESWASIGVELPYDLPMHAAPPQNPPASGVTDLAPDVWCSTYLAALTAKLTAPSQWNGVGSTANNVYLECLSLLTDSSVQAAGIIQGWLAGDALTAGTNPEQEAKCQTAFWTLLCGLEGYNNYTTVDVGKMVGYVFAYLSGLLASSRSQAMISGGKLPDPLTDPIKMYADLTKLGQKPDDDNVGNQLFAFILKEFYIVASDIDKAREYKGFIEGFESGLMLGADVMYQQLYTEAFNLGYTKGFKDGFTQGYTAGLTVGYGKGYAAAGNNWVSGLGNVFSGLSSTLKSADGILSDVGYSVSVISALL